MVENLVQRWFRWSAEASVARRGPGQARIWMLTVYAKKKAESVPGHILKKIKDEIDGSA